MNRVFLYVMVLLWCCLRAASQPAYDVSAMQQEHLNRGLVAVKTSKGVFVCWRLLPSEVANTVLFTQSGEYRWIWISATSMVSI